MLGHSQDPMERRKESMARSIIIPVISSTITGVCVSYMATMITLAVVETKVQYIETDMAEFRQILSGVISNKIILAERGVWKDDADRRLQHLETTNKDIDTKLDSLSEKINRLMFGPTRSNNSENHSRQ